MRKYSQIKHTALIAALASIYPLQVLGNAGVTQFSVGDVSVQRTSGSTPLASGNRIESGDLITTGATGRTQLRFSDGGMVSLQPNSQFKIARYADSGDAKQDSFLVDLARGGMRALTGLIGKRNRENYKVTTSTATIGIRGSGFSMGYNPNGTLSVTTELDAIEVCNQAGCVSLNLGESALVVNATSLPTRTNQRASWNPPNPRKLITARNEDVDSEGKSAVIRVETGLALTSSGLNDYEGRDRRLYLNGAAAGNASTGTILGYASAGESGHSGDVGKDGQITITQRTGSLSTGDLMILGTWQDAQWSGNQYESSQVTVAQSAFVMGTPTPQSVFDAAYGKQARYDLAQSTAVYSSNSLNEGTLLPTSHISVDFGSAQRNLDVQLDVQMSRKSSQNPAVVSSVPSQRNYSYTGSAVTGSAGFAGSLSLDGGEGGGHFQGFFGGPAAEKLGLSFDAETDAHGDIAGAGVFARGALISPPPPNVAVGGVGVGEGTFALYPTGTLTYTEGDITGYTASNGDTIQVTQLIADSQPSAVTGVPGDTNFLSMGQWAGLTWNQDGTTRSDTNGAFVMGTPTPSTYFSASSLLGQRGVYNLSVATPVYSTGHQGTGVLLPSSNLTIDFIAIGQYVDVALDVSMPGVRPQPIFDESGLEQNLVAQSSTEYQLRGSASGINGAFKGMLSVNTTACSYGYGANCGTGQAVGFIAGPNAEKAGISFSAYTGSSLHGTVYGAGVFSAGEGGSTPVTSFGSSYDIDDISIASASIQSGDGSLYQGSTYNGASGSFSGSFLTNYSESSSYGYSYGAPPSYSHVPSTGKSFAAIGSPTDADFIGWGYWEQATKTTQSYDGYEFNNVTSQVDHLHYLTGKPTPSTEMPRYGSANYSLLGGTRPTATLSNGQTQVGDILPTSNLAVNFTNSRVTANIYTKFGTTNANLNGTGQINGSSINSSGGSSVIKGFFVGSGAVRAGIVYQGQHESLGTIQGAAAFQRTSGAVGSLQRSE